jgi:hypothetical protein
MPSKRGRSIVQGVPGQAHRPHAARRWRRRSKRSDLGIGWQILETLLPERLQPVLDKLTSKGRKFALLGVVVALAMALVYAQAVGAAFSQLIPKPVGPQAPIIFPTVVVPTTTALPTATSIPTPDPTPASVRDGK